VGDTQVDHRRWLLLPPPLLLLPLLLLLPMRSIFLIPWLRSRPFIPCMVLSPADALAFAAVVVLCHPHQSKSTKLRRPTSFRCWKHTLAPQARKWPRYPALTTENRFIFRRAFAGVLCWGLDELGACAERKNDLIAQKGRTSW
jgi:hypothetical protein